MNVRGRHADVIWLGTGIGVTVIVLLLVIVLQRRRRASNGRAVDEVDPLFTTGIAITGAGAALALTLGGAMYGVMIVGLIVMGIGANRTRPPHH